MGFRDTLKKHPAIMIGATLVVVVVAIVVIAMQILPGRVEGVTDRAWYTADDGQTYFVDQRSKFPPIADKDGRPAFRAAIFRCGGGKPFVGFMERWTPEAKKILEDARAKKESVRGLIADLTPTSSEIKKPGAAKDWVKRGEQGAGKITRVVCPDGTLNGLEPIYAD